MRMMRSSAAIVLTIACIGCASTSVDPVAPVVLTDIVQPLECPEPEVRMVPAHLLEDLELETPDVLPRGEGDYGLTRAGIETLVDTLRALRLRLDRWRGWAGQ